jgi:signal transduction histidine kinase
MSSLRVDEGLAVRALARIPLLENLPRSALERLAQAATPLRVAAGAIVMAEGTAADGLYLLVSGELRVTRRSGGDELELGTHRPGDFLGELSLLEHAPRSATVRAVVDSDLLVIPPDAVDALLVAEPSIALLLLRKALERLRSTEAAVGAHARLVSLGTIAAGIAHEINNPAAALRRGLVHLGDVLDETRDALFAVARQGAAVMAAADRAGSCIGAAPLAVGTPAQRAAEDRLVAWLAGLGVPQPADLAPRLLSGGWSPKPLERFVEDVPGPALPPLLRWLGAQCAAHALLSEMRTSARAITDIVGAVRQHASPATTGTHRHTVPEGIASALLLLRSRITPGIRVERSFPAALPAVESFGSELNQVWLNLLENALHAVSPQGSIRIVARADDGHVEVDVTDDGPGIPSASMPRIFEPFYTTRTDGSGLGLHIVRTIVRRHRGRVSAVSRPGATTFTVRLPLRIPATRETS